MADVIEKAQKILQQPVCDHCLGRQFGQLLTGYDNEQRGSIIRTMAAMSVDNEKGDIHGIDMSNFHNYKFHNLDVKEETSQPRLKDVSKTEGLLPLTVPLRTN